MQPNKEITYFLLLKKNAHQNTGQYIFVDIILNLLQFTETWISTDSFTIATMSYLWVPLYRVKTMSLVCHLVVPNPKYPLTSWLLGEGVRPEGQGCLAIFRPRHHPDLSHFLISHLLTDRCLTLSIDEPPTFWLRGLTLLIKINSYAWSSLIPSWAGIVWRPMD